MTQITSEELDKLIKEKIQEVIESIMGFVDSILHDDKGNYSLNDVSLAHNLRLAIIFYRKIEENEKKD